MQGKVSSGASVTSIQSTGEKSIVDTMKAIKLQAPLNVPTRETVEPILKEKGHQPLTPRPQVPLRASRG